jgi:co-chaperonin GroES (HSP10)
MKAVGKNIVVKDIDEEIKTASGLILSGDDANQLRYKRALVHTPGTEVTCINAGDEIYYEKRNGYTMMINDEQFTIIQEREVVVVL